MRPWILVLFLVSSGPAIGASSWLDYRFPGERMFLFFR